MNTIGEALRNERQKSNISLEDIAQKTNIGMKSLLALENDTYKIIPGDFYLKNYIKSYLRVVGCDEKIFWETHGKNIGTVLSDDRERNDAYYTKLRYSRFRKKNFILSFSLLSGMVILTVLLLYISRDNNRQEKKIDMNPIRTAEIKPILPSVFDTDSFSLDFYPTRVKIEFLDNCWIQVYRGNKKIVEQVFFKGAATSIQGNELSFSIGNPSSIRFFLNEREVTYLKGLIHSERLTVSPDKIEEIFKR
jgi:cytoskeletal protein RodZ